MLELENFSLDDDTFTMLLELSWLDELNFSASLLELFSLEELTICALELGAFSLELEMSALERFALDELSLWLELMFHSDEEISINGLSEDDEISGRIKDDELTPFGAAQISSAQT